MTGHPADTLQRQDSGAPGAGAPFPEGRRSIPVNFRQLFVFVLVFWNSQIFSASIANPLGIRGVQEALYLILLAFTAAYLSRQAIGQALHKTDVIVFFLVLCPFLYAPVAARLTYGQPIFYGLIEERRTLAFLIYFPLAWAFRNRVLSVYQLLTWVFWCSLACAILSVLVYLGILQPFQLRDVAAGSLRKDRYGIGVGYVSMATLFLLHRASSFRLFSRAAFLALFLGVLVVIVQTRQILIGIAIAILIVRFPLDRLRLRLQRTIQLFLLGGILFVAAVWLVSETTVVSRLVDKYQALFGQIASEQYLSQSARTQTITSIMGELARRPAPGWGPGASP